MNTSAQLRESLERIDFSIGDKASKIPVVEELVNATVLHGGKRMRPYLCMLYGAMLGVESEHLETCAKVAEMVHAASLAHDDVIDEAKLRRRRKTLNAVTSNSQAVLAGNLLLSKATSDLVRCQSWPLINDLSIVLEELVTGEWLQLEARGVVSIDRAHLERVFYFKTASLLTWCCLAPLRLAGIKGEIESLTREFARLLGVAFQMVDDGLDFKAGTGKEFAKDFREGLMNDISVRILAAHPENAEVFYKSLGNPGKPFPWTSEQVQSALSENRAQVSIKLNLASDCLDLIMQATVKAGLRGDVTALHELKNFIDLVQKRSR